MVHHDVFSGILSKIKYGFSKLGWVHIEYIEILEWLSSRFDCLIGLVVTTDHEVAGSIPGASTNFKCGLGLEQGPPSLMRTMG